jgi:hypothetical protein
MKPRQIALAASLTLTCAVLVCGCSSSGSDDESSTPTRGAVFTTPAIAVDTDASSDVVEQQTTYALQAQAGVSVVLTETLEWVGYQVELRWDPSVLRLDTIGAEDPDVTCDGPMPEEEHSRAVVICRTTGATSDGMALARAAFTCVGPGVSVVQLVPAQEDGSGTTIDVLPEDASSLEAFSVVSGVIACDAG